MVWPGARSLLDAHIRAVTIEVMVHFCLLHVRRRHDGGETSCGRPHLVSPRRPSRPRLTCEQLDLRQRGIHPLDDLVSFVSFLLCSRRGALITDGGRLAGEGDGMSPRVATSSNSCWFRTK